MGFWTFLCLYYAPLLVCCCYVFLWDEGSVAYDISSYNSYLMLGRSDDDCVPSSVGVVVEAFCCLIGDVLVCNGSSTSWFIFFFPFDLGV